MSFTKKDTFQGVNYSIGYMGFNSRDDWKHFAWSVSIGNVLFEYKTGEGNQTKQVNKCGSTNYSKKPENSFSDPSQMTFVHIPKIEHVLHALFLDAQCGTQTFNDFCADFGYSTDSIKDRRTYFACQENATKLRKALSGKYGEIEKLIQEMDI